MTGVRLTGLLFLLAAATGLADPLFTLEETQVDGVQALIAKPTVRWTHHLLLVAQTRRPPSAPLKATLPLDSPFCRQLLAEGWILGSSAFPRNGTVIAEAVHSLLALREQIATANGSVEQAIVMGDGLGGLDAVLLSETTPGAFAGAIAIDPDLQAREDNGVGVSLDPKIPLVILSTQKTPLTKALAYVTSQMPRPGEDPHPVLLVVGRDGLCNVNDTERTAAFRALQIWLTNGPEALPPVEPSHPFVDVTSEPATRGARAQLSSDHTTLTSRVISVDPFDGSFDVDARLADLEAAHFSLRAYLTLSSGEARVRARVLPKGAPERSAEWLVYPNAAGTVRVTPRTDDSPALPATVGSDVLFSPPPPTVP